MDIVEQYMALVREQRWAEALPIIDEITARAPQIATSWFNYGVCLSALKRYSEAADKFVKAYELKPDNYGAQYRVFLSLYEAHDYDRFLAFARRECQEMPELIEILVEDELFGSLFTKPEFKRLQKEFEE